MSDEDEEHEEEHEEEEQEQQKVTAHSYGALDVSHAYDECWLVRFPNQLAELLQQVPEGTTIGELVFTKGGTKSIGTNTQGGTATKQIKPSITVHVSDSVVQQVQAKERAAVAAAAAAKAAADAEQASGTRKSNNNTSSSTGTGGGKSKITITSSNMPLNYSLQAMTKKIPVMHPFTRHPKTGSVELLGQVSRTANLQVEQDDSYRNLLKDRLVAQNITASRFVKPVEATESVLNKQQHAASSRGGAGAGGSAGKTPAAGLAGDSRKKTFGNAVYQFGKRMNEARDESSLLAQQAAAQAAAYGGGKAGGPNSKNVRRFSPDQPIRSVIFELFGQQQYWTVKDLKAAAVAGGATTASTKRAETEIRDVLREIGEYHRSGDHKTMWELRKEFQST